MSNIGEYPVRSFKENQKFLVRDPSTGTTSLVLGSDLVNYITPSLNAVNTESTRVAAENTDYEVGEIIQTSGATSPGDNFAAAYLVVEGGTGDFPMLNGNDLLTIKGDDFLREQLISEDPGEGASLISMEGGPTVESKVSQNSSDIVQNQADIAQNTTDITGLDGRLSTAESDIDSNEARLDTAEADIASAESRLDAAEADIDALEVLGISGIVRKESADVATTANITLSGEQTIDGVLTSSSRVLVKDQTATENNGVYVSAAGAWTRSTDMDEAAEIQGATIFVNAGTVGSGQTFYTASAVTTLGTDPIDFVLAADQSALQPAISQLQIESQTPFLTNAYFVDSNTTTATTVHTNRFTFTETSGTGTARTIFDLDKTYTAGEKILIYIRTIDNGVSDSPVGVGLYLGTVFKIGENTTITDGEFYRYELEVPVGETIDGIGIYVINSSTSDYDATFYVVREADEWALLEEGGVSGALIKELLDSQTTQSADAVVEGDAPVGPADINGLIRSFDGHDLLTTVGGTVKSWDSQDQTLTLESQSLATRPWVNVDEGIYFEDGRYMLAELDADYRFTHGLPDSTIAPNDNGGYTITGLDRDIRGMWLTGNDGRENVGDATFSPSIVILDKDFSRIYSEIALSGTFPGIETVQGVAWDSSDDTIWFSDAANTTIQHIDYAGADQGDGISLGYTPNGLAYDAANDRLIIGRASGTTVEIRSAADGTLVSSFDVHVTPIDHLHYDGEYLWITEGNNTNPGNLWVYTLDGKIVTYYPSLTKSVAIEGCYYDAEASKMFVCVDANFHASSVSEVGGIIEYDIVAPPSSATPSTLLWCGLLKRTNINGGRVIYSFGDPLGGDYGWALFWSNASNTLRFIATEAGTLKEVQWTVDADQKEVIVALKITDQTSVDLHLNGEATPETPSSTVGDWTEYPFGFTAATFDLCADNAGSNPGRQVIYGLITGSDITARNEAEGFLAHRWDRLDLLPAGHPYKTTSP